MKTRINSKGRYYLWGMLLLLFIVTSCYSEQKARTQLQKAVNKYPTVAADETRKNFPCISTVVDSSKFLESIDSLKKLLSNSEENSTGIISWTLTRYQEILDSLQLLNAGSNVKCEDELSYFVEYSSKLQVENEQLRDAKAKSDRFVVQLKAQLSNIKPVVKNIEDSAKVLLAEKKVLSARKEADQYRILYEKDHAWRTEVEARNEGKVLFRVPVWIIVLLVMTGLLSVYTKLKKGIWNPIRLIKP